MNCAYLSLSLSLSLAIYIYIYTHTFVLYIHAYIYIYIKREREREREREIGVAMRLLRCVLEPSQCDADGMQLDIGFALGMGLDASESKYDIICVYLNDIAKLYYI